MSGDRIGVAFIIPNRLLINHPAADQSFGEHPCGEKS
jgi:hypothetical protein